MSDAKRKILEQVAAGDLSPEEAAEKIAALSDEEPAGEPASTVAFRAYAPDAPRPPQPPRAPRPPRAPEAPRPPEPPRPPRAPAPPAGAQTAIARIKVLGDFTTARIIGDPSVAEAVADGPHVLRREGDTLVIDAHRSREEFEDGIRFSRSDRPPRVVIGLGNRHVQARPVSIRMNPDLPLEVHVDAGSVSIVGVRARIDGDVDAGALKIDGFESPINLSVDAGSVSATGRLTGGESKIRCDAGQVKIKLQRGSSVRVRARADVGKVVVGDRTRSGIGIGDPQEAVFGDGAGTLDIQGGIGRIRVEGS